MAAVLRDGRGGQFLHEIKVALDLVPVAVQQEGRVISIFLQDGPDLATEEVVARLVFKGVLSPHRHLDFQIDAGLVGCTEGRIRRAPGMEAHMIQSVILAYPHNARPRILIHRSMPGLWEHGVFHGSPEVDRMAVDPDVMPVTTNAAHSEGCAPGVGTPVIGGKPGLCQVEVRMEFVPKPAIG